MARYKLSVSGTITIGLEDESIRKLLSGEEGENPERLEIAFQELGESVALGEVEVTLAEVV